MSVTLTVSDTMLIAKLIIFLVRRSLENEPTARICDRNPQKEQVLLVLCTELHEPNRSTKRFTISPEFNAVERPAAAKA